MSLNEIVVDAHLVQVVCTKPDTPASGDPVRFGYLTGVAETDENAGGRTTVNLGPAVYELEAVDTGGGIALGDVIFLNAAATVLSDDSSGYFFGFALESVSAGQTGTIKVLCVPSPGSGTLGAGSISTTNLAANILSAAAAGRGKMQTGFFDVATILDKFAANGFTTANLAAVIADDAFDEATVLALFAADCIDNAELLKLIKNGAFNADAGTRALFDPGIWSGDYVASGAIGGQHVEETASGEVDGCIPVTYMKELSAGAVGDTDITITAKTRITGAKLILQGAGVLNCTLQVKNGANAITEAMVASGSDKAVVIAAVIDDANWEIADGGTLRITTAAGASQPKCSVLVKGVRVA